MPEGEPLRALWPEPAWAPERLVAVLHSYWASDASVPSRSVRSRSFAASASRCDPRPSATSRQWLSGRPPRVAVYSSRHPRRYGQRAPSPCVRDAQHPHLEAGRPDAAEFDRWVSDPSRVSHGLAWGTRVLHTVFQAKRGGQLCHRCERARVRLGAQPHGSGSGAQGLTPEERPRQGLALPKADAAAQRALTRPWGGGRRTTLSGWAADGSRRRQHPRGQKSLPRKQRLTGLAMRATTVMIEAAQRQCYRIGKEW